jgi:cytochrome P450
MAKTLVPPPSPHVAVARLGGPLALLRLLQRDPPAGFRRIAEAGDLAEAQVGPRRLLVVSHPAYIEEVLVRQHQHFVKGRGLRMARHVLGEGLLTSEGSLWRRQRQLSQPAFARHRVDAYGPVMVELAERQMRGWSDGASLDLAREMTQLTLSIATVTLFGVDASDRADAVRDDLTFLLRDVNQRIRSLVRWPDWVPTRSRRARLEALRRLDRVIYEIIEERRTSGEAASDLLDRLMAATDEHGGGMSAAQLRDEVMTLFLAGHETTANAMAWTWYLLAQNPAAEARLHEELDRVLAGRAPAVEDLEQLPWTAAVIQESLRLYPPAWILVRGAMAPFTLGSQRFPAGTQVVMSQWITHRDPRFWPDPDQFRPERWLPPHWPPAPFTYFPFGAGPRLCIGRPFALMEAALLLAAIARRYRFHLRPEPPVAVEALITLRPKYGIPAVAQARAAIFRQS